MLLEYLFGSLVIKKPGLLTTEVTRMRRSIFKAFQIDFSTMPFSKNMEQHQKNTLRIIAILKVYRADMVSGTTTS